MLRSRPERRVESAVRAAAAGRKLVLAVSGGRDSMALLHAVARVSGGSVAVVATFDHGTGAHASAAVDMVASTAAELGLPAVVGHATNIGTSEEQWRNQRRRFLNEVAAACRGVVTTAHTRDDQVETVVMRVLRDAGARGLAGLFAGTEVLRPLIDCSREDVADYAAAVGANWVDDPTNEAMRFFRNRVRRDLIPAISRVHPGFDADILELARRAAALRRDIEALVQPMATVDPETNQLSVPVVTIESLSRESLAALWPALGARVGLAMDWRGTERAAAFTNMSRNGNRMQLSGGWEIARTRDAFVLRRWR